jgi:hypothetical protein
MKNMIKRNKDKNEREAIPNRLGAGHYSSKRYKLLDILENQHTKVARLSGLSTGQAELITTV